MTDLEIPVCWGCCVGLHHECYDPQLHSGGEPTTGLNPFAEDQELPSPLWVCCCSLRPAEVEPGETVEKRGVGRPVKELSEITDLTSTGRKRAAMLYPIFPGQVCEWAGLKFAGGGIEPIEGCDGNLIVDTRKLSEEHRELGYERGDRHHGPSKSTLDNSPANVHRICSTDHNRWHGRNDRYYAEPRPPADQPWLPDPKHGEWKQHDPVTKKDGWAS